MLKRFQCQKSNIITTIKSVNTVIQGFKICLLCQNLVGKLRSEKSQVPRPGIVTPGLLREEA